MILEPITPTVLSVRRLPNADPAMIRAYGGDPSKHTSLGLVTVDQDDPTYVALDEATKHARVDVIFAKSFYAGSAHASGRLSGEILGVLAASEPESIEDGLQALLRCLEHDACFLRCRRQPHRHRVPARDRVARRVPLERSGPRAG
jgi:ethanolamine utilization protein EutL